LHLYKSYCLPLLAYNIGALELSKNLLSQLGICWNDAFPKIFGFHRWESVELVQYFCQELSFDYIYGLARWHILIVFIRSLSPSIIYVQNFDNVILKCLTIIVFVLWLFGHTLRKLCMCFCICP